MICSARSPSSASRCPRTLTVDLPLLTSTRSTGRGSSAPGARSASPSRTRRRLPCSTSTDRRAAGSCPRACSPRRCWSPPRGSPTWPPRSAKARSRKRRLRARTSWWATARSTGRSCTPRAARACSRRAGSTDPTWCGPRARWTRSSSWSSCTATRGTATPTTCSTSRPSRRPRTARPRRVKQTTGPRTRRLCTAPPVSAWCTTSGRTLSVSSAGTRTTSSA
mmetsp:Transcript_15081/g.64592  ORF Transcript_15081/g.64592 Transcript_15081/m.64592 type:complete len:222 (-) Transcript_15081:2135-2800(-)